MPELLEGDGLELREFGKELAASGACLRLGVRGWSMYPFLKDRDVVDVSSVDVNEIAIGDVVAFRSGDRMLAHRVVGVISNERSVCLRVRGDSFRQEDPPVAEVDLLGRVEVIYRDRRTGQRVIRLNRSFAGVWGRWVAQSRFVHRCVRWGARGMRRIGNGARRFSATVGIARNRAESEMERSNGSDGSRTK
jgi:hypothetical protein